ncbi:hypothetical protein BJX99DRAFT_260743 [Aspergillus californicus]
MVSPRPAAEVDSLTTHLLNLTKQATSLIETIRHGKLHFDPAEYADLEVASVNLSKVSAVISEEVKDLGKRRTSAVYKEGARLLSQAKVTREDLISNQKLRSRTTLFFRRPRESKFDSAAVKARKKLTRERCERIRNLHPDGVIQWAAAFTPSAWDPNALQTSTFDFIVDFIGPEKRRLWPTKVYNMLAELGTEAPLDNMQDYRLFLDVLEEDARDARRRSEVHETQLDHEAQDVDGALLVAV